MGEISFLIPEESIYNQLTKEQEKKSGKRPPRLFHSTLEGQERGEPGKKKPVTRKLGSSQEGQ